MMTMTMPMFERVGGPNFSKHVKMKASRKQRRNWSEDMMDAWLKEIPKKCIHCGSKDDHKFLQMANGKISQPRYKCKDCSNLFTHNGKANKGNELQNGMMKKITHDLKTIASNKINLKLEQDE